MLDLTQKPSGPLIMPSILAADFTRLGDEVADVLEKGADGVHVDIMDGHFVRQLSFGPLVVTAARKALPEAYLDCHLMVTNPEERAGPLAAAGANMLTFHAELADNVRRTLGDMRHAMADTGADVGVAINPATPAEAVFPILDDVKLVLVMSVVPGKGGQSFMPEVLEKVEVLKKRLRSDQRLEMDGGIDASTARQCRDAGCDWFVAGSAIFSQPDRAAAIADLRAVIGD